MLYLNFSRVLAALFTLSVYPLMKTLPDWMVWENQVVENLQVCVLLLGMIAACFFQHCSEGQWKWFWRTIIPVWFIMSARELSWGAAFYPPTQMTKMGPFFSSSEVWYRPVIYPTVALIIAATCFIILRYRTWEKVPELIRGNGAPWLECGLAAFFLLIAVSAEGHGGPMSDLIANSMLLEELAELAAYFWLLAAQFRVRQFQIRSCPLPG